MLTPSLLRPGLRIKAVCLALSSRIQLVLLRSDYPNCHENNPKVSVLDDLRWIGDEQRPESSDFYVKGDVERAQAELFGHLNFAIMI